MDPNEADHPPVVVLVTRSGGFAGLRREWRAVPVDDDVDVFITLISECPWTDASRDPASDDVAENRPPRVATRGADRFQWSIEARCGEDEQRQAELGEADLTGAWRALVDAVREWGAEHR